MSLCALNNTLAPQKRDGVSATSRILSDCLGSKIRRSFLDSSQLTEMGATQEQKT